MPPTPCLICGSETEPTDRFHPTPLLVCRECGLFFRGSVAAADVRLSYSDNSYSDDRIEALTRHRRRDAHKRARWTREQTTGRHLLEVGAGAGFFVESASACGFEAIGIEPSDRAARYARAELGLDVRTGFLETSEELSARAFDVICMWHVLEHVPDPLELLRATRTRLRASGRLVLEVPNIESVGADIFKGRWAHLDPATHIAHFSPRSLARALDVAGFRVIHLSTRLENYYDRLAFRLRPRRVAGRVARGLRLGTIRLEHPDRGELLRAVAEPVA